MEDARFRVVFRGVSRDEEGRKKVEITDVSFNNPDRFKHIEKKLIDKGVIKMERHGLSRNRQPKSGYGGKFTWKGSRSLADNELFDVPSAMDKGDPNYVDDDEEDYVDEEEWEEFIVPEVAGLVVGELEVVKEGCC